MGRRKVTQCKSHRVFQKMGQERAWSKDEKEALLLALRLHGTSNYKALLEFVPKRCMWELRNFLQMHKLRGKWRPKNPESEPPIDLWLNQLQARDTGGCLKPENSRHVGLTLKMIALCERHPPPELCGGVDFKELYYYVATIISGKHPRRISQPSAKVLLNCCLWLASTSFGQKDQAVKDFLARVDLSGENIQVKQTYSKTATQEPPEGSVNADRGLNPLAVPCEMLMLSPAQALGMVGEKLPPEAEPVLWQSAGLGGDVNDDGDRLYIDEADETEGGIKVTYVDKDLQISQDTEFIITVQNEEVNK